VARIFISYRRTDSAAYAGRLFDRLRQHFGDAEVFMDLEGIEPGAEFGKVIAEKARAAEVLIALIGRNWLTLANAGSSRRLDDPNDLLVREIETALEAKRLVIPVLAGNAPCLRASSCRNVLRRLPTAMRLGLATSAFIPMWTG